MNYGELADFVRYNVHEERFDNYQAVMIKTLIQKNGRTTKSVINSELQKTNPGYSEERDNSYVFDALLKAKIVEFDKETESFVLLNHESFSEKEKTNLIKLCNADIKAVSDIKSAILDFQEWLKSDEGTSRIEGIKKERLEFPKFMKNLSTMDKQTIEFTDNVLYGLLPNAESDNAKRISTFGAKRFQNIKSRKKLRDYSEKEWNKVANKIYQFASKFEMDSEKLDELIEEFISDKYSNSLQTGTISPILFCINDKFPVINNPVRSTYNNLSDMLGDNITIDQKLDFYMDEKEKVQRLIDFLNVDELKDLGTFSLFCKWFHTNHRYIDFEYSDKPEPVEPSESDDKIDAIINTLNQNRQIILYGPPGTGKTFTAKNVAAKLLSQENDDSTDNTKDFEYFQNMESADLVQFHPSYSYEDFVQGIKPVTRHDKSITYEVRDGIFKKICQHKGKSKTDIKILIIDEINRGNLSKIFGELIYALEYRNEKIRLQYADFDDDKSNDFLVIPENLYIIGTMNTADRSISLFDTAMRRRFAFIPMMVDYNLVARKFGLDEFDEENLRDELESSEPHKEKSILSLLVVYKLNKKISEDLRMGREKQIGHTYLLKILKNDEQFLNVWKYQIIPLLEEFYASKFEELEEILTKGIIDKYTGLKDFSEEELLDTLYSIIDV